MPGGFSRFWMVVLCLVGTAPALWAQFGDITDQPSDIIDAFGIPCLSWENLGPLEDLPFDTEISLRSGYDTNVETSHVNPISSFYTNGSMGFLYEFGTPRLNLKLDVAGGATYYYSRPGQKMDYSFDFFGEAVYRATPRWIFTMNARASYLSQPNFLIPGTDAQRVGDYWYTKLELGMTRIFQPRLSTTTRYSYSTLTYMDENLNDSYGRIDQNISQSLNFLVLPTTTVVAEFRVNPVDYYVADLDTVGAFLILGFDHVFNPRVQWNFRTGVEGRYEQNQTDGEGYYLGPYLDSNFNWQLGERSTFGLNFHYSSEPSGFAGVTIRQTFRGGLNFTYGLTQRVTMVCNLFYQHNFYDQPDVIPDITEQIFSGSLSLRYEVTRNISLQTVYQYTQDVSKEAPGLEYTRNVIYAGVNFLF